MQLNQPAQSSYPAPIEGLVDIDGRAFYLIPDVDWMPPFLMTAVSDGDRWMFVSSTGAPTMGRVDAAGALFPYETDDRLHLSAGQVGPVTRLRGSVCGSTFEWHPFVGTCVLGVQRSLAKSVLGDAVIFSEHHHGLGLTFQYRWNTTDAHGFVRTATLSSTGPEPTQVELLDGLVGLLPYGLEPGIYERFSNLSHAYKRSQLVDRNGRLAVFSLEAPVSDRPEPAEILKATTVWALGLDGATVSLDGAAVSHFERGHLVSGEPLVTGRRGAYLLNSQVELQPGDEVTWQIVADVGRGHLDVIKQRQQLQQRHPTELVGEIKEATRTTSRAMERIKIGRAHV